jgi:hypothetical protein
MLQLAAYRLPDTVRGIYGPNKDKLGRRQLLLAPHAAQDYMRAFANSGENLVASDMWRSADASLAAVTSGRGAQPPGYSGHNFGVSVDLAVDETMHRMELPYSALLQFMGDHGWFCFRRDGARGPEDWHFNYLNGSSTAELPTLRAGQWSRAAESAIQQRYRGMFSLDVLGVQSCLQKLRLYHGEIDGDLGPLTKQAVAAFARSWNCAADFANDRFQRTLAYLAADTVEAPLPPAT